MRTLLVLGFVASSFTAARADVVSDRVLLVTGGSGCGFKRIKQLPDGAQTQETVEYQVPYGQYLEITSIEYTLPHWMAWAKFFTQSLDVTIKQRFGTASTNILAVRFGNQTGFYEDAAQNFEQSYEFASQGAQTHVAAFPSGPLLGNAGRLCVTTPLHFWNFGGAIRVRGRLIASGEPPVAPNPGGGVLVP
jgi:hypothetical protein